MIPLPRYLCNALMLNIIGKSKLCRLQLPPLKITALLRYEDLSEFPPPELRKTVSCAQKQVISNQSDADFSNIANMENISHPLKHVTLQMCKFFSFYYCTEGHVQHIKKVGRTHISR